MIWEENDDWITEEIKWTSDSMIEVGLKEPDDFLKVRNTDKNWSSIQKRKEVISIMSYTTQAR